MEEKYIVVYKKFKDLEDNNFIYKIGDVYPREGLEPSKKRIKELSTEKNKIGKILIKKIDKVEQDDKEEEIKEDNKVEQDDKEE